jgi:hypothetical protein
MPTRLALACLVFLALAACGSGGDSTTQDAGPGGPDATTSGFLGPDDYCPGMAHCTGTGGSANLEVGVGKATFTPDIPEHWTDTNGNFEYDLGEPFDDANHNGKFDAVWLFGGNAANGFETDIEARAMAFSQHDVLVVICYLDVTGMFADDYELIRNDPALAGLDIDHIVLGAVHAHATPDTIGISNKDPSETGYDPLYVATVRAAAVSAIKDAVMSRQAARMIIAQTKILNDPDHPELGTDHFNKDIRDPIIYDPTLTIARFVKDGDPTQTIGTMVHWADHPEVSVFADSPERSWISAHFPHWLREILEIGAPDFGIEGLGGMAMFVQGPLGGQIGSIHHTTPIGLDGVMVTADGHEMDKAIGQSVGARALEALQDHGEEIASTDLALSYKTTEYSARLDNVAFQAAFISHILAPHRTYGYDPDAPVEPGNEPWLPLRATFVQIGPLGIVTIPGELHPELWVGGYDGDWSWGNPILSPDVTENVPDLANAPPPPYLRDLVLATPGVRYPMCAGLAEDYIGYIVPAYNFVLAPDLPYLNEAAGQHYEETYALGPEVENQAVGPILELVKWRAP